MSVSIVCGRRGAGHWLRVRYRLYKIREPATMVTDYLLATLALPLAGILLATGVRSDSAGVALWGAAFLTIAVAAACGGTVHGFPRQLGMRRLVLWRVTTLLLALSADLVLVAAGLSLLERPQAVWLAALAALKLALFATWTRSRDDFRSVVIDQSLSMAMLLALVLSAGPTTAGAPWIVAGVIVCFLAGVVQRSELAALRLNQNDLSHLLQLVAIYLLYRGGLRLGQ
jgi:hypothetical protein